MHLPDTTRKRLAAEPRQDRPYPWRFRPGDFVYVVGRRRDETLEVIGGELWCNFPHLHLRDAAGDVWRVSQLQCSSKTITFRKD